MSALIQSISSLSLSSRTLRGDAKVASPSTRAMPKNRTAVVTEAVRCFFLFFCSQFFFAFWPSSWCSYYHGERERRGAKEKTETVSRDFSLFLYASEIVLRSIPSRDDVFVLRETCRWSRLWSRARGSIFLFFALKKKFYPRERRKSLFFRFLAAKKNLSLSSSVFDVQRQKIIY